MPSPNLKHYADLRKEISEVEKEYANLTESIDENFYGLGMDDSEVARVTLEGLQSLIPEISKLKLKVETTLKTSTLTTADKKEFFLEKISLLENFFNKSNRYISELEKIIRGY